MVSIKKKVKNGRTYYYLRHTYREGGKVSAKEKYLGSELPKDMERIQKEFIFEIYSKKWLSKFEEIRKNYLKAVRETPKSEREKNMDVFSIRFTYDTQRIEGSTLSLRETANLIERGVSPGNKPIHDIKEAEAHQKIFKKMLFINKDLSQNLLLDWHRELLSDTKPDIAGKFRVSEVRISGSRFVPPTNLEVPVLMGEFFSWYKKNRNKLNAVELAALVHLKLVTVHPFADGNGRISRLAMNFVLNKHGFPMLNIEYENRNSYYRDLERSQTKKDDSIFLMWFFRRYLKENGKK